MNASSIDVIADATGSTNFAAVKVHGYCDHRFDYAINVSIAFFFNRESLIVSNGTRKCCSIHDGSCGFRGIDWLSNSSGPSENQTEVVGLVAGIPPVIALCFFKVLSCRRTTIAQPEPVRSQEVAM